MKIGRKDAHCSNCDGLKENGYLGFGWVIMSHFKIGISIIEEGRLLFGLVGWKSWESRDRGFKRKELGRVGG